MDAGLRRADRSRGNCDSVDEQHRLGSPSQAKVCESGVCGGGAGEGGAGGGERGFSAPLVAIESEALISAGANR